MENGQFGLNKHQTIWDRYRGKYIFLDKGPKNYAGKLVDIRDNVLILNPSVNVEQDSELGVAKRLVKQESAVSLGPDISVQVSTKRGIEAVCEYHRNRELQEAMLREANLREKGMVRLSPQIYTK